MDIDDLYMDVFQRPGTSSQGRLKPHMTPLGSRTPMTDDGSIDIYGDLSLDNFRISTAQNSSHWDEEKANESDDGKRNFSELQQLPPPAVDNDKTVTIKQQSFHSAKSKSSVLETKQNDELEKELAALKEQNKTLQKNISALYVTAKQELEKKDEEIKALKKIQKEQESRIISLSDKQSTSHHSGSSQSRHFLHRDADKEREWAHENYRDSVRERERVREKYKNADREKERGREKYRDGDRERERGRDNLDDFDREREKTRENLSGKYSNHKENDFRRDSLHFSRQRERRSRESSPARDPRAKRNRSPSGSESGNEMLDLRAKLKRKRKEKEAKPQQPLPLPPPEKRIHKRDDLKNERSCKEETSYQRASKEEFTYESSSKERQDSTSTRGSNLRRHNDFKNEISRSSRKLDHTEVPCPAEARQGSKQKNKSTEIDSEQSKLEVPKDNLKDYTKPLSQGHRLQISNETSRSVEKGAQTTDEIVKSSEDNTRSQDFPPRRFSEVEKETSNDNYKMSNAVRDEDQPPRMKEKQEEIKDKCSLRITGIQNKNCNNSADTFSETTVSDLFLPVNNEANQDEEDSMQGIALQLRHCRENEEILKTGRVKEKKELSSPSVHVPSSEAASVDASESSSSEPVEKMQPFESQIVRGDHASPLSSAIVNTAPVCSNPNSPSTTASPLPLPFTSFQSRSGSFSPATNETWPFEVTDSQSRKRVSESADSHVQKRQTNCDRGKSAERAFPISATDAVAVSRESISDLSHGVEKTQLVTMAGGEIVEASAGKEREKGLQKKHAERNIEEFRPFQSVMQESEDMNEMPRENDCVNAESKSLKCLKGSQPRKENISGSIVRPLQREQLDNDGSLSHLDSSSNSSETALESKSGLISSSSLQASAGTTLQTSRVPSLDTESSQTGSRDEQSAASAAVSSESTSGDGPSSEAGSADAQTESGSADSVGSNPKRQMVITKTTPVKAVTHITCTSNLIMLGDEESRTNFSSPSRPHYSASDFYPPGVMGIVREETTHSRHIRGMPEVIRQVSTGEDPTHGDGVEKSKEVKISENSAQSGIGIMTRISESEELDVCKEERLASEITKAEGESKEINSDSREQRVQSWEENVKEQFRKVFNQDLAGFQTKKALHSHANKKVVLEKAFGRLRTALKPSSTKARLKERKLSQKNKNLETKAELTLENSLSRQSSESDQTKSSLTETPQNVSAFSSDLPHCAKLSSELSKSTTPSACSSTKEAENATQILFHSNPCNLSSAENRPTKNHILPHDYRATSSQVSMSNRNTNSNKKLPGIDEPSSRFDGRRKAVCSFSFDQWKPKLIQQCGAKRSRNPQESQKENTKIIDSEVADSPEEPDWLMEQILESLDCPWETAMERDFTSTTDTHSLHWSDTDASHTKTLSASHDGLREDKHSLTQSLIHKDSRHVLFPSSASASKDQTKSDASTLSHTCKVTSSDEDASSSNLLHTHPCRKNKSPDSQTPEADSTCGVSSMMVRHYQEHTHLSEESDRAGNKGRQSTPGKQLPKFSGLDSLRATDKRDSDPNTNEAHTHKLSLVQRGPPDMDQAAELSNPISQSLSEPASPIQIAENKSDAAFRAISILRQKDAFLPDQYSEDGTPKNIIGYGNHSTSNQSNLWEDRMSSVKSYVTEEQEECAQFPRAANEEHVLNRTFTVESPELNSEDEAHSDEFGDYGRVSCEKKKSSRVDRSSSVHAPEEISLIEGSLSEFDIDMTGLKQPSSDPKKMSSPSVVPAAFSSFSKPVHSPRLKQLREDMTVIQQDRRMEFRGNETPDSDATIEVVSPCVVPVASRSDVVNSTGDQLEKRMSEVSASSTDYEVLVNVEDTNKSLKSWQSTSSRQMPFQDMQKRNLVKSRYGVDVYYSSEDEFHSDKSISESECVDNCVSHGEQDVVKSSESTAAASINEMSEGKVVLPETFSAEHIEYFKNVNKVKKKLNLDKVDAGKPLESRHTMTPCKVPASPFRVIRDVSTPDKLKVAFLAEGSRSRERKETQKVESDRRASLEAGRSRTHKQRHRDKELSPTKMASQKLSIQSDHQQIVSGEMYKEMEKGENSLQDRTATGNSSRCRKTAHQRPKAKFAEVEKNDEKEKIPQNVDWKNVQCTDLEMPHLAKHVGSDELCSERLETAVTRPSTQSPYKKGESINADAASHSDLEEGEITDEEEENQSNGEEIGNGKSESTVFKDDVGMSRLHEEGPVSGGGAQHTQQATSSRFKIKKLDNKAVPSSGVSPLDHLYQQESKDVKKYDHWKSDWMDEEEEEKERKRTAVRKRRRSPSPAFGRPGHWARRKETRREDGTRGTTREKFCGGVQERRVNSYMQKESKLREDTERSCEFNKGYQRRNERGSRNESVIQNSEGWRRSQNYRRSSPERDYDFHKNEMGRRQKYERQDRRLERGRTRQGKLSRSPHEHEETRRRSSNSTENVPYFKETTHKSSSIHKLRAKKSHSGSQCPDDQWSFGARSHSEKEERSPSPQLIADACLV